MVIISDLGGKNEKVLTGCVPKKSGDSACGIRVTEEGRNRAICCCKDRDNCNDDDFVAKCKTGTAPLIRPKGFTCIARKGSISFTQDCSGKNLSTTKNVARICQLFFNLLV